MSSFKHARKEQLKARVALAGPSGAGKTYTALRLAKGLAQGGKVAVIDTERRSASLYADEFEFDTMDFQPPYKPEGLRDAIRDAQKAGYAVLIIDSFTHFWSGPGGVLEVVDRNAKGGNSWSGWAVGTPLQQQVVDTMLTANLHVIACMRSKQEWAQEKDERTGKTSPKRIGMGVQQRGDIEYEFTIFGELDLAHRLSITKSRCKALADRVEPAPGEAIAEELLAWLSSGEAPAVVSAPVEQLPPPELPPADKLPPARPRVPVPAVDAKAPLHEVAQQLKAGDPAREANGALARLDAEHAAIADRVIASKNINLDDADAVVKVVAQVEKQQKATWLARQKRANAAMGPFNLDDDARHAFVSDATAGATSSTAQLTAEQCDLIVEAAQ